MQNRDDALIRNILLALSALFVIFLFLIGGYLLYNNWKNEIARLPPKAPSELVAKPLSATKVQLTWKDNSNNEIGFMLYRDGQKIATLSENVKKYVDINLRPATTYSYEVKAYNKVAESVLVGYSVKTLNPSIIVVIDKIGVHENGEEGESFRELWDMAQGKQVTGEVQIGLVVTDGKNTFTTPIPAKGYYELRQDAVVTLNTLLFSSKEVGDSIRLFATAYEQDGGFKEEVIYKVLDIATGKYIGNPASLILTLAGVDFSKIYADIFGAEDDWLGSYDSNWNSSNNWGVGNYVDIQCKRENGHIGLRLWFRIYSLDYDYSSEKALSK